jgi:lysophospholipase L1-like esterase
MNRILVNSSVLIFSVVSALILAEVGVRAVAPQNLSGSWRINSPVGLLVNESHGIVQHQGGDRIAHYSFYPPHLRDTPLKDGLHTVLALGDSFTFGWFLNEKDTFISKLQDLVDLEFGERSFNLVNAAAGGWGTADYVAYVEEFGNIVRPDVILVFLNTDDVGRSFKSPLYSFVDRASLVLARNRVEPDTVKRVTELIPFYEWLLEHLHSVQLLRKAYLKLASEQVATPNKDPRSPLDVVPTSVNSDALRIDEAVDLTKALFLRLRQWADDNGSVLYVTTTGWHRPPYDEGPPEPTRAFMAIAERFFEEAGIPYKDVSHDVLRVRLRGPESFIIANDGHPNECGSQLIAKSVWPFIREKLHEFRVQRPEQARAEALVGRGDPLKAAKTEFAVNGRAKDRYSVPSEPLGTTAGRLGAQSRCSERASLTTKAVDAHR